MTISGTHVTKMICAVKFMNNLESIYGNMVHVTRFIRDLGKLKAWIIFATIQYQMCHTAGLWHWKQCDDILLGFWFIGHQVI